MKRIDIGIIGGADGPTQIYVTPGLSWYEIVAIILTVLVVAVLIIRTISKQKRRK